MPRRVALLPVVWLFLVLGLTLLGGSGANADTSEPDTQGVDTPRRQVRWYAKVRGA
jgi:hypothetical protein